MELNYNGAEFLHVLLNFRRNNSRNQCVVIGNSASSEKQLLKIKYLQSRLKETPLNGIHFSKSKPRPDKVN